MVVICGELAAKEKKEKKETRRDETKRNETKRNEAERNATRRDATTDSRRARNDPREFGPVYNTRGETSRSLLFSPISRACYPPLPFSQKALARTGDRISLALVSALEIGERKSVEEIGGATLGGGGGGGLGVTAGFNALSRWLYVHAQTTPNIGYIDRKSFGYDS